MSKWHVQIVNKDGTMWFFPPVDEDKAYPVMEAMREAYPEFDVGLREEMA